MLAALLACALASLPTTIGGNVVVYSAEFPHFITNEFPDAQASFGGDFPDTGLKGVLAVAEPEDGCTALKPPPPYYNSTSYKWIVLIARYNCNFETKIRNAQSAGYECAIVHNVNASDLETMSAKDPSGITIPSVFVSDKAGDLLKESLYDEGYYLIVNGDLPFDISTHLLLPFAVVVALCLFVMVVFLFVKCMTDRARARRHRLPTRSLKKIPTCKFSKGDPYDMCAICLDEYQEGERLRVLPCAHAYHSKCIDPWLTQNRRVCPVCKRRVLACGERTRSESDSDDSREPLVSPVAPPTTGTQGGTFEPQRENPFVRAARFMARMRGRPIPPDAEVAPDAEEQGDTVEGNEADNADETRPLIQPSVTSQSERRRSRRRRRPRSASPRRSRPHPPAPTAMLRSAEHSINAEAAGEIGVAAIPAPAVSQSGPARNTHIDL